MTEINEGKVKVFWQERATEREKHKTYFSDKEEAEKRNQLELDKIKEHINYDGKYVLDVGCGLGNKAFEISKKAKFVVGLDYTKAFVKSAEKEAHNRGIRNVRFMYGDSTSYDYGEIFDVVIISALFIYMNDDSVIKTIENVSNHLREGGIVFLKESVGVNERFEVINKWSEELKSEYNGIYRTSENLVKIFKERGFCLEKAEKLYQHREETAVWFFIFKRKG